MRVDWHLQAAPLKGLQAASLRQLPAGISLAQPASIAISSSTHQQSQQTLTLPTVGGASSAPATTLMTVQPLHVAKQATLQQQQQAGNVAATSAANVQPSPGK